MPHVDTAEGRGHEAQRETIEPGSLRTASRSDPAADHARGSRGSASRTGSTPSASDRDPARGSRRHRQRRARGRTPGSPPGGWARGGTHRRRPPGPRCRRAGRCDGRRSAGTPGRGYRGARSEGAARSRPPPCRARPATRRTAPLDIRAAANSRDVHPAPQPKSSTVMPGSTSRPWRSEANAARWLDTSTASLNGLMRCGGHALPTRRGVQPRTEVLVRAGGVLGDVVAPAQGLRVDVARPEWCSVTIDRHPRDQHLEDEAEVGDDISCRCRNVGPGPGLQLDERAGGHGGADRDPGPPTCQRGPTRWDGTSTNDERHGCGRTTRSRPPTAGRTRPARREATIAAMAMISDEHGQEPPRHVVAACHVAPPSAGHSRSRPARRGCASRAPGRCAPRTRSWSVDRRRDDGSGPARPRPVQCPMHECPTRVERFGSEVVQLPTIALMGHGRSSYSCRSRYQILRYRTLRPRRFR